MSSFPLCPACKQSSLAPDGVCPSCGAKWPVAQGVLKLVEGEHPFYEGAYAAQVHLGSKALKSLKGRLMLPFVNFGYLKAVNEVMPAGGALLELGCGGGCVLFGERFRVTAVDFSFSSLVGTPQEYAVRVQADATKLEFAEGTFDGISASCFWEHLTNDQKETLLAKFRRWLKPGGKLVLFFDTGSENPVFRAMRGHRELYQQCFVDHDGHVGLESVHDNLARFEKAGLELRYGVGLNRTIQHLPVYTWIEPYAAVSGWAKWLSSAAKAIARAPALVHGFTAAVHVWDMTLGRPFPVEWSRLYLGIWEQPPR